jgi:hypothetical protein
VERTQQAQWKLAWSEAWTERKRVRVEEDEEKVS